MQKPRFTAFPVLKTERLILRQLVNEDENEIFKLRSDKDINEYLDRPEAISVKDATAFIQKINRGISEDTWIYWAITIAENANMIGTICVWNFAEKPIKAELGFELLPV